jgi:hypothetical protein
MSPSVRSKKMALLGALCNVPHRLDIEAQKWSASGVWRSGISSFPGARS